MSHTEDGVHEIIEYWLSLLSGSFIPGIDITGT